MQFPSLPIHRFSRCAIFGLTIALAVSIGQCQTATGQTATGQTALEKSLLATSPEALYDRAIESGNSSRGAILFHGPLLGCGKCHSVRDSGPDLLGPNLSGQRAQRNNTDLVDAVLRPSLKIDEAYRSTRLLTEDGQVLTGLLIAKEDADTVTLRDLETLQDNTIPKNEIVQLQLGQTSIMPEGLMRGLSNQQDFDDLLRYLIEIRDQGAKRARELQPTSAQLAIQLPDYEAEIDHRGFIEQWGAESYDRGQKIYEGLCINCHGTRTTQGSLATALRFGEGKFKFGTDPYSMYQTLTRGGGLMLPQPWMVPEQKYDVIHYLREEFLAEHNRSQLFEISDEYLRSLPEGTERGPEPQLIEPWSQADYGPRLVNTYEIGSGGRNIAQKGIAIQLDGSPGGVAHGEAWAVFDHDTMRLAGVWSSRGFIDWQGIHFNGRHGIHPHIIGDVLLANSTGPGWARPDTGKLDDDERVIGRDGKRYGPLPNDWCKYEGLYQVGRDTVIAYSVGGVPVHESYRWDAKPIAESPKSNPRVARRLTVGPRTSPLQLVVATLDEDEGQWVLESNVAYSNLAKGKAPQLDAGDFQGNHYYQINDLDGIDMFSSDFTITARITAEDDGTIFSRAPADGPWAPGGQTLFVRGGRLCYDVGWVGAVQSNRKINDGVPHAIALTWRKKTGLATLWIDGERVGKKRLTPKKLLKDAVARIGFTSDDFPSTSLLEAAEIQRVSFYSRELRDESELLDPPQDETLIAKWAPESDLQEYRSSVGAIRTAQRVELQPTANSRLVCGWNTNGLQAEWEIRDQKLLLTLPASTNTDSVEVFSERLELAEDISEFVSSSRKLAPPTPVSTEPGKPVFPETITTEVELGADQGGFAVDLLRVPTANPWQARVRTSGLDFFEDGDRIAVSTWDGDVWIVSGVSQLNQSGSTPRLTWRRVAFGLFQPLGLKIIDGTIFLTCRDQLVRLDDRNGDGEIDYYHCVNNDHQVTEHFHEFAMGLQTDDDGNFYYAKSARHALPAVVPHHGTLLKVAPDGSKTEILANGFRAANGVCLNPDGTFIVTDQEGHWNPKNRINWVRKGGFYGNMYGYHQVTDESDSAMEQPLCWITNKFDRSPAELLWVHNSAWGPLEGQLLNLSYGYGKVYVVPHETVDGQVQGGMCQLPIEDFPTGTMRGRFSPFDGQLYLCGLAAWATNQTMQEGGLYRIRYTHKPVALPTGLSAEKGSLRIAFSESLGEGTSLSPDDHSVRIWSLKRTKNYGSDHYDERDLKIQSITLSEDRRELRFEVPDLQPTWCMEIVLTLETADGRQVERIIHNTIHNLENNPRVVSTTTQAR